MLYSQGPSVSSPLLVALYPLITPSICWVFCGLVEDQGREKLKRCFSLLGGTYITFNHLVSFFSILFFSLLKVPSKFLPHVGDFCSLSDLLEDLSSFAGIYGMSFLRRILENEELSIWFSIMIISLSNVVGVWWGPRRLGMTLGFIPCWCQWLQWAGLGSGVVSAGSWVGVFIVDLDDPSHQWGDPAGK